MIDPDLLPQRAEDFASPADQAAFMKALMGEVQTRPDATQEADD